MFVPVACLNCGKPFQVPEAAVGTSVSCPWCKHTTAALPVAGLTAAQPLAPGAEPPLELDDAPPAATPQPPRDVVHEASIPSPATTVSGRPARPFPFRKAVTILLASAACGVAAFLIVGVIRGTIPMPGRSVDRIPTSAWHEFRPPDGSCSVALPGAPDEAEPIGGTGKRYVTYGWFSGVTTWFGWIDLDGEWLLKANTPEAWHLLRPRFDAIKDHQKREWQATIVRETTRKFDEPLTVEVEMQFPDGTLIERFIVVTRGSRPRIYYVGLAGRGVNPDHPATQKLFASVNIDSVQP